MSLEPEVLAVPQDGVVEEELRRESVDRWRNREERNLPELAALRMETAPRRQLEAVGCRLAEVEGPVREEVACAESRVEPARDALGGERSISHASDPSTSHVRAVDVSTSRR